MWNVASHKQVGQTLAANAGGQQHDFSVNAVVFSPDGATLATAGTDGIMRLWDLDAYQQIGSSIPAAGTNLVLMEKVAFSPDGAGRRGGGRESTTVECHHTAADKPAHRHQRQQRPGLDGIQPQRHDLGDRGAERKVRLWSVATRQPIGPPLTVVSGGTYQKAAVNSVAFTPDGRLLATGRENGKIQLYSVATRRQIGSSMTAVSDGVNNDIGVSSLAFTPGGSILATADGDDTARLWDVATDHQIGPALTATKTAGDQLTSVAFTRGGSILVTGEQSGAARLWDVATFHEIGPAITIPDGSYGILAMAVSPNGEMLATVGDNEGNAQLWSIAFPADLLSAVCAIAGSSLTVEEWASYTHSQPYRKTC